MCKKKKICLLSLALLGIGIFLGLYMNSRIAADKKYETIQSISIQITPVYKHSDDNGSFYEIKNNGQVTYRFSKQNENYEYEVIEEEIMLSPNNYEQIIRVLKQDKILEKPENLTTDMDILDGGHYRLTIQTKDNVFLLEGTNPQDKDFNHCLSAILKIVQDSSS
ncbi:hypothetical protein [Isobaculum melis]|uniref:Uncharacterized protein n=1 Tax=Isobaculum melis TaxID=142588 RepID=A0A1H9RV05_9LACT|nr:hypothetical protein [Isobaculum melis]SER76690.1 hypothetical protein SAMN04488559_105111 [Isobaculum melis]